jgi:hypothetical protein
VHDPLADGLNDCKYLYLRELGEPRDNELRIVVEEASVTSNAASAAGPLSAYGPIESNEASRLFELRWENYVAYSVSNESFATTDEVEQFSGRLYRLYSCSHFLDYVRKATFATDEYPGPLRHVGILCLNHIVDIAAVEEPMIRRLRPV